MACLFTEFFIAKIIPTGPSTRFAAADDQEEGDGARVGDGRALGCGFLVSGGFRQAFDLKPCIEREIGTDADRLLRFATSGGSEK
jgi:hypothetical protein